MVGIQKILWRRIPPKFAGIRGFQPFYLSHKTEAQSNLLPEKDGDSTG
jgi:hypothetical protein